MPSIESRLVQPLISRHFKVAYRPSLFVHQHCILSMLPYFCEPLNEIPYAFFTSFRPGPAVRSIICLLFCRSFCHRPGSHHYFRVGSSGTQRKTQDKLQNFESGIEIQEMPVNPWLSSIFLLPFFCPFDVEVIFFYPYAVNFRELGWDGFIAVMMFVGFSGRLHLYFQKGALKWEE